MQGTLVIRPILGDLTRNTDFFTKMDPYVKVFLGTQHHQTSVAREQGKHPNWNDELTLQYYNQHDDDDLQFQVWDEDTHKRDDLVGTGSLAVATVLTKGNKIQKWVQLFYNGKSAGQILVDVTFTPKNGTNQQNQNYTQAQNQNIVPPQNFQVIPNQMNPQGGYYMMSGSQIPQYNHAQTTQQFIFVHQGSYPHQNFMPQQVHGHPGFSQQTSMQPHYQSQNSFPFQGPNLIHQQSCPINISQQAQGQLGCSQHLQMQPRFQSQPSLANPNQGYPYQMKPEFPQQTQMQAQFQQQPSSNLDQQKSDPNKQGSPSQPGQVQVQSEYAQQTQYQSQNSFQLQQQQSISVKENSPPKGNNIPFDSYVLRGV